MPEHDQLSGLIAIEVAYATPLQQVLLALSVPQGTTIAQAIDSSGLKAQFPEMAVTDLKVGVFATVLNENHVLKQGDRVEIYRPLCADPKEARRRRAKKQ